MTEHPILFQGDMVNAILQGNKTQTRRVIKPQPTEYNINALTRRWVIGTPIGRETPHTTLTIWDEEQFLSILRGMCPYGVPGDTPTLFGAMEPPEDGYYHVRWDDGSVETRVYLSKYRGELSPDDLPIQSLADNWCWSADETGDPESICLDARDPNKITWRKNPGDILWVRETFFCATGSEKGGPALYHYRADAPAGIQEVAKDSGLWRPSIHMPKEACRLRLRVEDVRVERVQDITEDDVLAEGVAYDGTYWRSVPHPIKDALKCWPTATVAFLQLWNSINQKRGYGWTENPWCWAVTFSRIEAPDA